MVRFRGLSTLLIAVFVSAALAGDVAAEASRMEKRWLFVWRTMSRPNEVDRMMARFPAAEAAGYNGVAFSHRIPDEKAVELKTAAEKHGLDLIPILMGSTSDRNYVEGIESREALFVVQGDSAVFVPDNPTTLVNGGFEKATGDSLHGWRLQDDPGKVTFVDQTRARTGGASLKMTNFENREIGNCRVAQAVQLQPWRQYRVTVWVKTEGYGGPDPEVKMLTSDSRKSISWQTFRTRATQDWTKATVVFNSMDHSDAQLYVGIWGKGEGTVWWDDLEIREVGMTNVLRREGTPVTVKGNSGVVYEEGVDYEAIVDPQLHPWKPVHDGPSIRLTDGSRISDEERLRVSFYHPIIIYEDRVTSCLSEPKIFDDWRAEVERIEKLLHPPAFFMSHDELRVANQCAHCRSMGMTAGELLAWNVRKAAAIIRDVRSDAEIWVWSDMFDPMHNAKDNFYAVNGSFEGSWEGLDPGIGIVNWHGGLMGKNAPFFADLGCRQILSGYYDSDEDGARIGEWIEKTAGVKGIVGAMYTTWEDKYEAMEVWAGTAWGNEMTNDEQSSD